jgi:hypothetical protein
MLRNVVAIVVGYAAIVAATFLLLTLLWTALGPDGAFEPGTYRTSTAWALGSLLLGFVAAAVGGLVCARIAATPVAPKVFAAVVLVLGILFALPTLGDLPAAGTRPPDISMVEAMRTAATPPWVAFATALVGAAGVLVGARLGGRPGGRAPSRTARHALLRAMRGAYSSTLIPCFAEISFRIFGHTVTLTSPRCAFLRIAICVRDWPIPPPIDSGTSPFRIAWW